MSTSDKRIAITLHENQRLNIGNQYQKDATYFVPGIIKKFEESHNVILYHIYETVKERKMKYQKIVIGFFTWLESKGFLIKRHRKQLQTVTSCEIQEIS